MGFTMSTYAPMEGPFAAANLLANLGYRPALIVLLALDSLQMMFTLFLYEK